MSQSGHVVKGSIRYTMEISMTRTAITPGQKIPDSGIYKDTSSGERSTLVRGKTAPPTERAGGKWRETVDTNPSDRSSRGKR
jgi:hypothetical protein